MVRGLFGTVVVLVVLWVVVKLVFGIVGAVFHLLPVVAVGVDLYALIKAGAERRTRASARARVRGPKACCSRPSSSP